MVKLQQIHHQMALPRNKFCLINRVTIENCVKNRQVGQEKKMTGSPTHSLSIKQDRQTAVQIVVDQHGTVNGGAGRCGNRW